MPLIIFVSFSFNTYVNLPKKKEDRTVAKMDSSHVGTDMGEFHNFDDGQIMV